MTKLSIHDIYYKATQENIDKYGEQTIVFMQVGAFYELYGSGGVDGIITNTKIKDVCDICNLSLKLLKAQKNDTYMAGFPDYRLEKFLNICVEQGYTVVIYNQITKGKLSVRELSQVCSKGTIINNIETNETSNNIACIWCEKYNRTVNKIKKEYIVFGLSVINIMNGSTNVFECSNEYILNPTVVDEIERQIMIYNPSEYIFLSNLELEEKEKILQFINLSDIHIHDYDINQSKIAKNCSSMKYIVHCMEETYGSEINDLCYEFNQNMISTQALVFLLNFLREHNPNLIEKLQLPVFSFKSNYVLLANHTLKQLNIIKDTNGKGKISSVCGFLNNCKTNSGKRLFEQQMLNPTNNVDWLQCQYDINKYYENNHYTDYIRQDMDGIKDIEFIMRHCINNKCTPQKLYNLYDSIVKGKNIQNKYENYPEIVEYLSLKDNSNLDSLIEKIEDTIDLHICKNVIVIRDQEDICFKSGKYSELDNAVNNYHKYNNYFINFYNELNKASKNIDGIEYFKLNDREKSGTFINLTKIRSDKFKKNVSKIIVDDKEILISEIKFTTSGKSIQINHPLLEQAIIKSFKYKEDTISIFKKCFIEFINELMNDFYKDIQYVSDIISKLDVLQTRIYNAKKYNYCLPIIKESDHSYLNANDMRHCLIEHIQKNEIYVPNNVMLGSDDSKGMLLYGTNAVGKTSLIRAIGICVILAQSGNYVPCSNFDFFPYNSIFSRILGNDNIFKGLSTFAVEMSELRVILNNSDENSLILGDELCSGTEVESALSIFMSGLEYISRKKASYIFATHFHEILDFTEINLLEGLLIKHMDVYYDKELEALVYNRKLKDGSGSKYYGLEVCKSMFLPPDFLERAYILRSSYFFDNKSMLEAKSSPYNSLKLKDKCELCGEKAIDIHHMIEQHKSDDKNFIGHFHKNHKANLMSICKKCHDETHSNDIQYTRKKTTNGYITKQI